MTGETIQSTVFLASNSIPSGNPQHSNQKESMERRIKHSYTKLSQKHKKPQEKYFYCGFFVVPPERHLKKGLQNIIG